jgi:hypothetical protein
MKTKEEKNKNINYSVKAIECVCMIYISCIMIVGFFYVTMFSIIALDANPAPITLFSLLACVVGLILSSHEFCMLSMKKGENGKKRS